jgi:hypothetical protein
MTTDTQTNAIGSIVAAVLTKLSKTGRAIWKPTDNQAIVPHVLAALTGSASFVDWSNKSPEGWRGVLIVNTKARKGEAHVEQTRGIAFPDMDTLFADAGMRGMLFDRYLSMLSRALSDPEAEENSFSTIGGPWAEEDKGSYTFQAPAFVTLLIRMSDDPKGMEKALNTRTLRMALESAEAAKSRFPGLEGKWTKLIDLMMANAERNGRSVAIFEHWKATRDVVADAKKITVSGLDDSTENLLAALGTAQKAA